MPGSPIRLATSGIERSLGQLLSVLVRNLCAELFLESHHQFHRVQGIGTEIFEELCLVLYLVLVHTVLLIDGIFYFFFNI